MSVPRVPLGEPALISATFYNDAAQTQPADPSDVQLVIHPPGEDDVTIAKADLTPVGNGVFSYEYASPSWGDVRGYWKSTEPDIVIPFVYEVFAV